MPLRSRFFNHIFTLFTGSAGAQVVTFLFYLVLARVYLPEHFGYIAIYTSTVIIIGEIVNGRFDLSILLPSKDSEALSLLRLCLLLAFAITALTILLIIPLYLILGVYGVEGALQNYFLFLPLSVLVQGVIQPLNYYLNRTQKYAAISWYRFLQAATTGGTGLLLGILGWMEYGLLAGFVGGQVLALLLLLFLLRKNFAIFFLHYPLAEIKEQAKKYKQFPKYSVASALLNSAGRQSPFYLLALFFGADVTGHFSLAFKLITAPVLLIAGAYGQVFYERAVKLHNKLRKSFRPFILKNVRNLFLMGIAPIIVAGIWGQQIVVLLLGEKWMEAGIYLEYLAPFALMLFVINPIFFVINIRNKLPAELLYNIFLFIGRLIVLIAGGLYFTSNITIGSYSALGVSFNLFLLFYILAISGYNKTEA